MGSSFSGLPDRATSLIGRVDLPLRQRGVRGGEGGVVLGSRAVGEGRGHVR